MQEISALMDGELDQHEAAAAMAKLKQDRATYENWLAYHAVRDALQGGYPLPGGFAEKFSERLSAEPTVLAPHKTFTHKARVAALSLAASVAGVALVAWLAFSGGALNSGAMLAGGQGASAVKPAGFPAGDKMSAYLLAHQEFSPATAIQGVAPYVRAVSAQQPDMER